MFSLSEGMIAACLTVGTQHYPQPSSPPESSKSVPPPPTFFVHANADCVLRSDPFPSAVHLDHTSPQFPFPFALFSSDISQDVVIELLIIWIIGLHAPFTACPHRKWSRIRPTCKNAICVVRWKLLCICRWRAWKAWPFLSGKYIRGNTFTHQSKPLVQGKQYYLKQKP